MHRNYYLNANNLLDASKGIKNINYCHLHHSSYECNIVFIRIEKFVFYYINERLLKSSLIDVSSVLT